MSGVNKAIILGFLGADPEVRFMPNGNPVANFSVATSEKWKDKNTGEKREKTEWHKIVAFGRLGEICGEYLSKGKQVYIEGKIQTEEWIDRDQVKRYTTKIIAQSMTMLGGCDEGKPRDDYNEGGGNYNASPPQEQEKPTGSTDDSDDLF